MEFGDGVAVVTGGARGIGAALAQRLARERMSVVVADIDLEAASATAAGIEAGGTPCIAVRCDVGLLESVRELAARTRERFGRVDVLVNNAGVTHSPTPAIELSADDARWVLETNVLGVWHGCATFGPWMVEQGSPAHIVNIGSEHSLGIPMSGAAMYTASKHAILGLSDVLRRELPAHVGVSVVCPGGVQTELVAAVRNRPSRFGGAGAPRQDRIPIGMTAEEIAERTVTGIRNGDFYIVTHPPVVELAQERWQEVSAAFAAQAPRFTGDEIYDTRELIRRRAAATSGDDQPTETLDDKERDE
ncbi:SDR family NAD(P)-dependent oxidoreductase [Streptomyces sp. NPDC051985]|uniref:SDR family NAD(P)-dependent oxidoreductase n=1 Tax=Streptomyces sp. NPDC051985 TaxID=3155807 RepID=UPI0034155790